MKNAQLANIATRRNETRLDAPLTITLPSNLSATIRYVAHLKGITPEEEILNGLASMNNDLAQTIFSDGNEATAWLLGKEVAS